ncbi:dihydrofolate reductase family protein [Aerococcaceae bacterium NML210727]|nr:dihydrofolate reductase family protein [Aerococcaceae bacterium NML210727]MCW6654222.1 dihydrofolate reductase family protein [Aerococcaceae bacterium NML201296]MCW6663613.1 dihydrofolate reductase family protein [Aerococcaceae bacterium NML190073]MCW6664054.1 dihydrofolate reductase family protein [Aerococcaceae bacterium NML191219]MCW6679588.1 dihydrofolate reductase family protein [Aerococcaceae bacterium NML130460]MCW6681485.1 dihydrofolate reductase family protein [Aerococcaceae bacter
MRKVKLFIAMSVDGYIADKNGGVGFLKGHEDSLETEDTYSKFIKNIDIVLMGWNTYNQIITELSPDNWVYDNLLTYVFTHRKEKDSKNIIFTSDKLVDLIEKLKKVDGKDIWICGGANLVQQALVADIIDEYFISVIPTILGDGIKLFGNNDVGKELKLINTTTSNGTIELNYIRG